MMWVTLALASEPDLDAVAAAIEGGHTEAALAQLVPAAAEGSLSLDGWYDLGIAWLHAGDPAEAVAALRPVVEARPRDGDALEALALARGRLDGAVPSPVPPHPLGWFLAPWEAVASGALLALAAAFVRSTPVAALGWLVGVLLAGAGAHAGWVATETPVAVTRAACLLRDAPRDDAADLTSLPAGAELRREAVAGPWWLVAQADGRRGWAPSAAFGVRTPSPD